LSGVGDPSCWWCEGWGCRRCRPPHLSGEQSPSNEEVELGEQHARVRVLENGLRQALAVLDDEGLRAAAADARRVLEGR